MHKVATCLLPHFISHFLIVKFLTLQDHELFIQAFLSKKWQILLLSSIKVRTDSLQSSTRTHIVSVFQWERTPVKEYLSRKLMTPFYYFYSRLPQRKYLLTFIYLLLKVDCTNKLLRHQERLIACITIFSK